MEYLADLVKRFFGAVVFLFLLTNAISFVAGYVILSQEINTKYLECKKTQALQKTRNNK